MDDNPRKCLCELLNSDRSLVDDPKRLKSLMLDYCWQYKPEVNVIMGAYGEKIPQELLSSLNATSKEMVLQRLSKRLKDNLCLHEEAAIWAVDTWALALGLIKASECRNLKKAAQVSPSAPVTPVVSAEKKPVVPPASSTAQIQRQTAQPVQPAAPIEPLSVKEYSTQGVFGAHRVQTLELAVPVEKAYDLCLQSLGEVKGCKVHKMDRKKGLLEGKVSMNWLTYGHWVVFDLKSAGPARTAISLTIKPITFPGYYNVVIDWGRGQRIMDTIIEYLKKRV